MAIEGLPPSELPSAESLIPLTNASGGPVPANLSEQFTSPIYAELTNGSNNPDTVFSCAIVFQKLAQEMEPVNSKLPQTINQELQNYKKNPTTQTFNTLSSTILNFLTSTSETQISSGAFTKVMNSILSTMTNPGLKDPTANATQQTSLINIVLATPLFTTTQSTIAKDLLSDIKNFQGSERTTMLEQFQQLCYPIS